MTQKAQMSSKSEEPIRPQTALCTLWQHFPKECEILASVMDTDDDGQIDYDEFVAFLYPPER